MRRFNVSVINVQARKSRKSRSIKKKSFNSLIITKCKWSKNLPVVREKTPLKKMKCEIFITKELQRNSLLNTIGYNPRLSSTHRAALFKSQYSPIPKAYCAIHFMTKPYQANLLTNTSCIDIPDYETQIGYKQRRLRHHIKSAALKVSQAKSQYLPRDKKRSMVRKKLNSVSGVKENRLGLKLYGKGIKVGSVINSRAVLRSWKKNKTPREC
eukprot:TRINITY_DN5106_c0_g1_i3.p1 TRINITY_DN5106_c0_g1~~TRINITY_DN5106_c0_g1_i3.p1  ORF type:complete len:212 (+),score=10.60 TRINITY_DN5106_c0_g1_i3:196-831(+)